LVQGVDVMNHAAIHAARTHPLGKSDEPWVKELYEGEYGKVKRALGEDPLAAKLGVLDEIAPHSDRLRAKPQFDEARAHLRGVRQEIKAYNAARPVGLPATIDARLQPFATELTRAHQAGDAAKFLAAYHQYLCARKLRAIDGFERAYKLYILSALE